MLNRRILRIKAFKELFAIEMKENANLASAQKELDVAIESTRDLYLMMLSFISALTSVAAARQQQLSLKVNKTDEEKNPNLKFIRNPLAVYFDTDPDFSKAVSKRHIGWGAYDLILQKIYAGLRQKQYFLDFMSSPDNSLAASCALFTKVYEEEIVDRDEIWEALEDINIYWNDDLPYCLTCCCRTLSDIAKGKRWALPELYLSSGNPDMDDDSKFVHRLLQEAYANYPEYSAAISSSVPNWDKDRLVATDVALMVTALAEIVYFPEIPINVSINEYVEISKYFGTPKSSVFVNGILDSLSRKERFKKHQ